MDLRELLRDLQVTTNVSVIQRATGLNRRAIIRYRAWARGLFEKPRPLVEELQQLIATPGTAGTAIWRRLRAWLSWHPLLGLPLSCSAGAPAPAGDGPGGTRAWQQCPSGLWLCWAHAGPR
jgi:hypothetical protein